MGSALFPNVVEDRSLRGIIGAFADRAHAGWLLAQRLRDRAPGGDAILLAIPSGGIPVACAIARALGIPIDVAIARKLQIPWNPEAGFGAVAWDGTSAINEPLAKGLGLDRASIEAAISRAKAIAEGRLRRFRGDRPFPDLRGKAAILVDDGLASGFTMLAAVRAVRKLGPGSVLAAAPTASNDAISLLAPEVDWLICLNIRGGPLFAVADAYREWRDIPDDEAADLLEGAWREGLRP
jgi:predicted phosphoribosyltransferase